MNSLSVNFIVVLFACWQAIRARNIKSEFSESNYIALAVGSMSQVFLTGIPIVAMVREAPEVFYLVLTFLIFLLSMVVMLLIFLPKMLMQRKYSRLSKSEQKKMMVLAICVKKNQRFLEDDFASALSFSLPAPLSLQLKASGRNGTSGSGTGGSGIVACKYQQARRISGLHFNSGKDIVSLTNKINRYDSSSRAIDGVSRGSGSGTSSSKNVRFAPLSRASRSSDDSSPVGASGTDASAMLYSSATAATAKIPRVSFDLDANDLGDRRSDHYGSDCDSGSDDGDPARSTSTTQSFSSTGADIVPYFVCHSSDQNNSCVDVNDDDDTVDPTMIFKTMLKFNRSGKKNNDDDTRGEATTAATHEQDQSMPPLPPQSSLLFNHFISQVDRETLKTDRERATYDSWLSVAMAVPARRRQSK
jgi:hypothetical protein